MHSVDGVKLAFPNVDLILWLFWGLMILNCSGESSFSQLKRTKNELWTSMSQEKLFVLSNVCIENDKLLT